MNKILLALAMLLSSLAFIGSAAAPAQAAKCSVVKNDYGAYDQFEVDDSGPRYNGSNVWRTAIVATYKSCPNKVKVRRIGVEFRWISSDAENNKCASIRDFTANLAMVGFNPGAATTDCNGQVQRFISWVPANPVRVNRGGFINGSWSVDVSGGFDKSGSYARLYPRFGA